MKRPSELMAAMIRWGGLAILAVVFAGAGVLKILANIEFADALGRYQLFGNLFVGLLAVTLPWFELFCGGLLWARPLRRVALLGILAMCTAFAMVLGRALLLGRPASCGCFGAPFLDASIPAALARVFCLWALSAVLLVEEWRRKPTAVNVPCHTQRTMA